jgi:hypothetical protein
MRKASSTIWQGMTREEPENEGSHLYLIMDRGESPG